VEYRKEIDGLRAIAILGVLFFHVRIFSLRGGYLGVDVFFVISGFLISTLLFAEAQATGTISLSDFYLRRSRRILPALFVVLSATFVPIYYLTATTPAFAEYARSIPAAALFVSNIFFWQNSGYFAVEALQSPLLHTWTLGVEEQFYIVIPFVILLLCTRLRLSSAKKIMVLFFLMVLSFLFCRYGKRFVDSYFLFYMLPTRMWELLLGVVATLVVQRYKPTSCISPRICDVISLASLAVILAAFFFYRESTLFAEKSLVVVLATGLILVFSTEGKTVRQILGAAPLRFIGNISYSMYLWHWPLITIAFFLSIKYGVEETATTKALTIAATILFSTISWNYIEKPIRSKKSWRALSMPLFLCALAVLGTSIIGLTAASNARKPFIVDNDQRPTQMTLQQLREGKAYHLGVPGKSPEFMLMGDSHARSTSQALDIIATRLGIAGLATTYSNVMPTPTMHNIDTDQGEELAKLWLGLAAERKIKKIIIVCNWSSLVAGIYSHNGKIVPHTKVIPTFLNEFTKTLQTLLDQGCEIWLMEQVPSWRHDPVLASNLNHAYFEMPDRGIRGTLLSDLVKLTPNPRLHILDPWDIFVEEGKLFPVRGGRLLYFDSDHLSQDGARLLVDFFRPVLEAPPFSSE